jgi:hypothetical protein
VIKILNHLVRSGFDSSDFSNENRGDGEFSVQLGSLGKPDSCPTLDSGLLRHPKGADGE